MAENKKNNTVLFVDDEIQILNSIRRATSDEAYTCVFANSGSEALQVLEERAVSVIVTDMRMPGMDGLTLLKTIREKYPETVRIVLSGYTQLSQVLATVNQADVFQFIPKPWQMEEELLATVRRAIEHFNLKADHEKLREGLVKKNAAYQNIFHTMEQLMANQRRDVANIKRVNRWMFAFGKKYIGVSAGVGEEKARVTEYINLIEELQLLFLDTLPAVSEAKAIVKIISDIEKACMGRMVIQCSENKDHTVMGYHGFISMTCKALVYIATGSEAKVLVLCKARVDTSNPEMPRLVFEIDMPLLEVSEIQQNRLRIACSFLNEIGKAYLVELSQEVREGQIVSVHVTLSSAGLK